MKNWVPLLAALAILMVGLNLTPAHGEQPDASVLPVYFQDGTLVSNAHIVIGQIPIPAGPVGGPVVIEEFPVTLSGAAAYSSADSYKCFLTEPVGATLLNGGLIKITGANRFVYRTNRLGPAWQQDYFCVGK